MRKIKGIMSAMLTVALVFSMAFNGFVVSGSTAITVEIDGKTVNFPDQQPVVVDGRTLVPVRGVFETLGYTVSWEQSTNTATLSNGVNTIIIRIGQVTFTTNGNTHTLDVPAQTINGRTMLPLRAVLESVGMALDWNGTSQTVLIATDGGSSIVVATNAERALFGSVWVDEEWEHEGITGRSYYQFTDTDFIIHTLRNGQTSHYYTGRYHVGTDLIVNFFFNRIQVFSDNTINTNEYNNTPMDEATGDIRTFRITQSANGEWLFGSFHDLYGSTVYTKVNSIPAVNWPTPTPQLTEAMSNMAYYSDFSTVPDFMSVLEYFNCSNLIDYFLVTTDSRAYADELRVYLGKEENYTQEVYSYTRSPSDYPHNNSDFTFDKGKGLLDIYSEVLLNEGFIQISEEYRQPGVRFDESKFIHIYINPFGEQTKIRKEFQKGNWVVGVTYEDSSHFPDIQYPSYRISIYIGEITKPLSPQPTPTTTPVPTPQPTMPTQPTPQPTPAPQRVQCLNCNGTGRAGHCGRRLCQTCNFISSTICCYCNGTGWR